MQEDPPLDAEALAIPRTLLSPFLAAESGLGTSNPAINDVSHEPDQALANLSDKENFDTSHFAERKCYEGNCSGRLFRDRSALRRHQLQVHALVRLVCPVHPCSKRGRRGFTEVLKLREHLELWHKLPRPDAEMKANTAVEVPVEEGI